MLFTDTAYMKLSSNFKILQLKILEMYCNVFSLKGKLLSYWETTLHRIVQGTAQETTNSIKCIIKEIITITIFIE